jgi:Caspase domain
VPSQRFTPQTTLVVILGASEFPFSDLPSSEAFRKSAQDLEAYFRGHPFNVRPENLKSLFDHKGSPLDINRELSEFLTGAQERARRDGRPIRDLILYYVGHGGFTKSDQAYFLALNSTEAENEGVSGLRMVDLAGTLKRRAKDLRRYLILDCCFAEQAYQYYQSSGEADPADVAHEKARLEFPETGTALLCSSSKRDFSIAPKGEPHTMFSGALLDVQAAIDSMRDFRSCTIPHKL